MNKWDLMLSLFTSGGESSQRCKHLVYEHETVTIKQLYSVNVIRELLQRWLDSLINSPVEYEAWVLKGDEQSRLFREFGNELYKAKPRKLRRAVEFYTKAIYLARDVARDNPYPSLQLSLAHANRAVALMSLGLFQEAFDDCELAVKNSYPKENILKVLFRQAGCSLELNNRAMLAKVIKLIENELKNHKSSRGFYMKILAEYKEKMQHVKKATNKTSGKDKDKEDSTSPKKVTKVEKSEEVGRFVKATEKITENQAIMTDRAFAFVPVYEECPDDFSVPMDCQNCAKTNIVQFPCDTCHCATYCSLACLTEHHAIHQYECTGYQMNLWYYIGIAHLSLRTFLTGFPELVQRLSPERDLSLADAWARLMKLAATAPNFKYGQVLSLVANFDKMADSKDFIRYSLTATMLVVYLRDKTPFFKHLPQERILKQRSDWELLAGSLIMLHMGQLVSNGHAISALRTTLTSEFECIEPPDTLKVGRLHCFVRSVRAFTGLFPRVSLLNHSCDANIWNSFNGSSLTIHASRPIAAGEEVFNCYGPSYRLMDTKERRQALSEQYCFECKCTKCQQVPEDKTHLQFFKCSACSEVIYTEEASNFWWRNLDYRPKIACPKCGKRISFRLYTEFLEQLGKVEAGEVDVADVFANVLTLFLNPMWGNNNEMRLDSGIMILSHFIPFMPLYNRLYMGLLGVTLQLMEDRERKFGVHSMEFVMATTYYYDVLALRRSLKIAKCELERPKDLEYMRQSLKILAPEARSIFERYIAQYITAVDEKEAEEKETKEKSASVNSSTSSN